MKRPEWVPDWTPDWVIEYSERFGVLEMISKSVIEYGPTAIKVVIILIVGHFATRAAQRACKWFVNKIELGDKVEGIGAKPALAKLGLFPLDETASKIAYWLGLAATFYLAADAAKIAFVSNAIGAAVAFLPTAATAAAILGAGMLGADFARAAVSRMLASRSQLELGEAVPNIIYAIIVMLAGAMAADQLGLDIDLVQALILMTLGATALGISLAFGLGFSGVFSQMVARYHVKRSFEVGDSLEFGEIDGKLVRFGPTVAIFDTADGRMIVPYAELISARVLRLGGQFEDEIEPEPDDEEAGDEETAHNESE